MKKLLICTFAYGWYQDFAPLYAYTILRAYPDANVKILLRDPVSEISQAQALQQPFANVRAIF